MLPALMFLRQKNAHEAEGTSSIRTRISNLKSIRSWILGNRKALQQAIDLDLKKPVVEFETVEVLLVLSELKLIISKLRKWTSPRRLPAAINVLGTRSWIYPQPKGVCLILSPWNLPFSLTIGPLVAALAAGNRVILKPSEISTHMTREIQRMAKELFPEDLVAVVEGDAKVSQLLLEQPSGRSRIQQRP